MNHSHNTIPQHHHVNHFIETLKNVQPGTAGLMTLAFAILFAMVYIFFGGYLQP
jgi:hypothetical protein